jgi:hypothetical protein
MLPQPLHVATGRSILPPHSGCFSPHQPPTPALFTEHTAQPPSYTRYTQYTTQPLMRGHPLSQGLYRRGPSHHCETSFHDATPAPSSRRSDDPPPNLESLFLGFSHPPPPPVPCQLIHGALRATPPQRTLRCVQRSVARNDHFVTHPRRHSKNHSSSAILQPSRILRDGRV